MEKKFDEVFFEKWKNFSNYEKLNCYGMFKLKYLARKKKINFENLNKDDLINKLKDKIKDNDLPIKIDPSFSFKKVDVMIN